MADINMKEQIQMLIELQGLDGEIFKRKRVIESVPGRLKQLDDELEKEKDTLKNLEEESKQIQVKRKEKEMDLEVKEAEIKKHQAQLMQVKTNKEYDALKKEIADRAADKSVLEEEIIAMLDEVDGIQKEVSRERDVVEEKKKKFVEMEYDPDQDVVIVKRKRKRDEEDWEEDLDY